MENSIDCLIDLIDLLHDKGYIQYSELVDLFKKVDPNGDKTKFRLKDVSKQQLPQLEIPIFDLKPNLVNYSHFLFLVQSWGSKLHQTSGLSRDCEDEWLDLFQKISPIITEFRDLITKRIQINKAKGNDIDLGKKLVYVEEANGC